MNESEIRADGRTRVAHALTRYLTEGPGTYRVLLDYIGVEYSDGMAEGWLDMNNALSDHGAKVVNGERRA